jgi:uncharacterized RDD family membrane protein YckC
MSDEPRYIGLATRTIAFLLDLAAIYVVAVVVGAGIGLVLSLFKISDHAKSVLAVIGAVLFVLWAIAYFVGFWSATGETPGDRLMRIRVVTADGQRLKPRWALVRCVGLVLSALLLFIGYLMILFDGRRRALHDRLARTVVVESPTLSLAAQRRAKRRAVYARSDARSSHSGDERGAFVSQA